MNFWKIWLLPVFAGVFLYFSGTVNSGEFKKTLVFSASTVQLMNGKLGEFQRFRQVFLHFLGRCIRVFFIAHLPALFAHSHPALDILLLFL